MWLLFGVIWSSSARKVHIVPNGEYDLYYLSKYFCSFDSYHPSQYVTSDNNRELLYMLRTPMIINELKPSGVEFSHSQLILLHIGGLIESKNNILHTVIPIFDKTQTDSLRRLSRTIAEEAYAQII